MPSISEREYERLKTSIDELSTLNQIASAINLSMSVDKITQVILDSCLKRLEADQGAVFLLDDDLADVDMFHTFVRDTSETIKGTPFHLNKSLVGWMIKNKTILIVNDPASDSRFPGIDFREFGVKSLLSAPLMSRKGLIGLLVLINKNAADGFAEVDKRFLGIVGTQAAKVIENARLFEKEQRLKAIEEEMKVAKSIQDSYLPSQSLSAEEYEVLGFNQPAKAVGGDYFDMFRVDADRLLLSLGDVSGKGVPAALLASEAQAVVRSLLQTNPSTTVPGLAESLNRLFCQMTQPEQYITAFMAAYDTGTSVLKYVNAGHLPPLVVSLDGKVRGLEGGNLVIGVIEGAPYIAREEHLEPGDTLFVYTDGITENLSPDDEEFGEERLKHFLSPHCRATLTTLRDRMISELSDFRHGTAQSDDITFLMLRVR